MLERICKCLIGLFSNRKIIQWLFFIQILCMKSLSAMLFQPSVSIFFVHKVLVLHIAILTQYRNIPIYFGGEMSTIEATLARQRQLVEFLALLQQHFEFSAQTSKLNLTRSNSFSADHISRERDRERTQRKHSNNSPSTTPLWMGCFRQT